MYDTDIHLMVKIFQEIFQFEGKVETDPAKYVKRHENRIKKAGQLFQYLDLAEVDAESPLGWRPTHSLMELIAKRMSKNKPRGKSCCSEDLTSAFLWVTVFGG